MTKKEMLDKLYESVEKFIEAECDENLIDFILDECVNFGMLPPEGEFLYKRDLGDGLEVSFYKKERKWEINNEENL